MKDNLKDRIKSIVRKLGIPRLLLVVAAGIVLLIPLGGSKNKLKDENDPDSTSSQTYDNGHRSNRESGERSGGDANEKAYDENAFDDEYANANVNAYDEAYEARLEEELNNILSGVEGIGKTKVMITLSSTAERITLRDEADTVYEEKDHNRSPYVVKEIKPEVKGVLIAAQGGDNTAVKKEIIEAVEVLFEIEPHRIKVMKLE